MASKIIGLTGKAGSGKDTVGAWLRSEHHYQRIAMADALKKGLAAMGFPEPESRADKESLIPGFSFTWRQAAQRLGTEWGRGLDEDIWLKVLKRELEHRLGNVVVTDIRFENEAAMIRELGGSVWHITGRQAELGGAASHQSEAGVVFVPGTDLMIDNSGSIADLHVKLGSIENV